MSALFSSFMLRGRGLTGGESVLVKEPHPSSFIPHVPHLRQETGNSNQCLKSCVKKRLSPAAASPVACGSQLRRPRPVCPPAAASPPSAPPASPLPSSRLPPPSGSPSSSCPAAFSFPVWLCLVYSARRGSSCTLRRGRPPARPGGTSRPPGWEGSDPGAGTAAPGRCSVCSAAGGTKKNRMGFEIMGVWLD